MIGFNEWNSIGASIPNPYMPPSPLYQQSIPYSGELLRVKGGIDAVRSSFPLRPNSTIAVFDEDDDIMYIKRCDAAGAVTIRKFSFAEVVEKEDSQKYLTIDEFNKFKEELLNGKQFIRSEPDPEPYNPGSASYRPVEVYYGTDTAGKKPVGFTSNTNAE